MKKIIIHFTLILCTIVHGAIAQQTYEGEKTVSVRNDSEQVVNLQVIINKELGVRTSASVSTGHNWAEIENVRIEPGESMHIVSPLILNVKSGFLSPPLVEDQESLFYFSTVKNLLAGNESIKSVYFHVSINSGADGKPVLSYSFSDHLPPVRNEAVADGPSKDQVFRIGTLERVIIGLAPIQKEARQ